MGRGRARGKAVEWVGGVISMPAYVTGEGEPYRPEALFWFGEDGAVLGSSVLKPGGAVAAAAESLRTAIEAPAIGKPHVPARVRVASPELAAALRTALPAIEIVCAPTPELDEVAASLREHLAKVEDEPATYFVPGVDAEALRALFAAAAALFRVKPWDIVPADADLISVTIPALGIRDVVISVIGRMGTNLGFILWSGMEDFKAFLDAHDAIRRGEQPRMPPSFSLNFERGADLAPELRKEVATHGWKVAGANAYPWLVAVDEDLVSRPPGPDEIKMAEAICLALPRLLAEKAPLIAAWNGGEAVTRTFSVATHSGDVEVTLRVSAVEGRGVEIPDDLLTELEELEGDEIDDERRHDLEDELLEELSRSPEGEALADEGHIRLVMDIAAGALGATIATLDEDELRSILFEVIPRQVDVDASQAGGIVGALAALYTFLDREYDLPQAHGCLRLLQGNLVTKLEAALSNPRNFGPGKLFVIEGRNAGFDTRTEEGLAAWMRVVQARQRAEAPRGAAAGNPRAKKSARSAARKARRKNR